MPIHDIRERVVNVQVFEADLASLAKSLGVSRGIALNWAMNVAGTIARELGEGHRVVVLNVDGTVCRELIPLP